MSGDLAAASAARRRRTDEATGQQCGLGGLQATCEDAQALGARIPKDNIKLPSKHTFKAGRSRSYRSLAITLGVLHALASVEAQPQGDLAATGTLVRMDPRFDHLVPPDAKLERLADGFGWVEGPVWHHEGRYLLFSDVAGNAVYKWKEGEGVSLFLKPSGYTGARPFEGREPGSNGLTFDPVGRLVLAQHGDRRISRLEKNSQMTPLVDRYHSKRLNSPNDLVFKSNGDLYFTDPPFGLPRTFDDPSRELGFSGVYRLSARGELTLLVRDLKAPNGIAFSPDERTLYVTDVDSQRPAWYAYDVQEDGTLANGRVFSDARAWTGIWPGAPDGLKLDQYGNLFAAGPGGVYVFAPDGRWLGRISTGVATANCAWGEDGSVLYIAASHTIYRIRVNTQGTGF